MKVLHLTKYYHPYIGGIEQVTKDIVQSLNISTDIYCDVLCFNTSSTYIEESIETYKVYRTASLATLSSTAISPQYIQKFAKFAKNYDIIHIHHPNPIAFLALFLVRPSAKIIIHWHADIIRQKKLLKLFQPLQRWALQRADAIITTSQNYADHSQPLQDFKDKIQVIPIGIRPPTKVTFKRTNAYKNKKIIFSLGRLVSYKGFDVLINSAEFLDEEFIILIGGDGPLYDHLHELIEQKNLQNKVKLLGRLTEEEKSIYFQKCFLFCLPSITKAEAFGVVLLEAMTYAKPIVSTNIIQSGMSWVNKDDETGILVQPNSPQQLASAFKKLASDEELYKTLSKNALKRYKKHFTREKMITSLEALYKTVLVSPDKD